MLYGWLSVINRDLHAQKVPLGVLIVNQITSNQFVRAALALALFALITFQVTAGKQVDATLSSVLGSLVGYYFGENSEREKPK